MERDDCGYAAQWSGALQSNPANHWRDFPAHAETNPAAGYQITVELSVEHCSDIEKARKSYDERES